MGRGTFYFLLARVGRLRCGKLPICYCSGMLALYVALPGVLPLRFASCLLAHLRRPAASCTASCVAPALRSLSPCRISADRCWPTTRARAGQVLPRVVFCCHHARIGAVSSMVVLARLPPCECVLLEYIGIYPPAWCCPYSPHQPRGVRAARCCGGHVPVYSPGRQLPKRPLGMAFTDCTRPFRPSLHWPGRVSVEYSWGFTVIKSGCIVSP